MKVPGCGSVTITATYSGSSKTATLTVLPQPVLSAVSLNPVSTVGGTPVTGIVTLNSVAPNAGVTVTLSSDTTSAATVPANVVVPSGQTTQTFTVTTLAVNVNTTLTISASYNGTTKTATFVVQPPILSRFTLSPNNIAGGQGTTGNLTLSGPAPANCNVNITCSDARALLTGPVTVPQGATTVSFSLWTSTVNVAVSVTVTASYSGVSLNASLTLTPTYLHASEIYLVGTSANGTPPNTVPTIRMTWNSTTTGYFKLYRAQVSGGTIQQLVLVGDNIPNTATFFNDPLTYGIVPAQWYYYVLKDSNDTFLSDDMVVPMQVFATDNQTVDSRVDPRYATLHYVDYPFGTSVYKGGLFAGYAADQAKVGRSVLKFPLTRPSVGDYRGGQVCAYFTGAVTSGSSPSTVVVGCQALSNTSWSGSTAVWSQLFGVGGNPGTNFNPGAVQNAVSLTFDPATHVSTWTHWNLDRDILNAATNNQTLSVALAAYNENNNGWAYFAKDIYQAGTTPCVLTLWDYVVPITVTLSPTMVNTPLSTVSCTVALNGIGLGDTANVALSITGMNASAFTSFPSTLTATGYLTSRQFTFTVPGGAFGGLHGQTLPYTITATCNGVSASAVLTVVTQ